MLMGAATMGETTIPESGEPEAEAITVDLGPLPNYIGFAIRRAQLYVLDDFIRSLEKLDLRPGMFSTLTVIERNPGLNQSEVSASLGIQRTNFVIMVQELERRQLIERRPSKNDKRSYALYLTRKGKNFLKKAQALQAEHEVRMTEKLGADGRDQLLELMQKLLA